MHTKKMMIWNDKDIYTVVPNGCECFYLIKHLMSQKSHVCQMIRLDPVQMFVFTSAHLHLRSMAPDWLLKPRCRVDCSVICCGPRDQHLAHLSSSTHVRWTSQERFSSKAGKQHRLGNNDLLAMRHQEPWRVGTGKPPSLRFSKSVCYCCCCR